MKALTNAAKNLIAKTDAALDYFWVGIVRYRIERKLSEFYWKWAAYVQDFHVHVFCTVPTEKLNKLRHQAKRHALQAQLIKESFK